MTPEEKFALSRKWSLEYIKSGVFQGIDGTDGQFRVSLVNLISDSISDYEKQEKLNKHHVVIIPTKSECLERANELTNRFNDKTTALMAMDEIIQFIFK